MDAKSLKVLEFHKVLQQLAEHTAFSASNALALALRPTRDIHTAQERQARTSEACRLLSEFADTSVGGARDVRSQASMASKGGTLTPEELLDIKATLISARDLSRFFEKLSLEPPHLKKFSAFLTPTGGLIEAIGKVLDDKGEVKDSASQKLGVVRGDLKQANQRAVDKLTQLINNPANARMLQEEVITKRAERYVVPLSGR